MLHNTISLLILELFELILPIEPLPGADMTVLIELGLTQTKTDMTRSPTHNTARPDRIRLGRSRSRAEWGDGSVDQSVTSSWPT